MLKWIKAHLPTKRRLIQLYAALLFNANLKGFQNGKIYQGPLKNVCTPGLNCYSCPGASGACPMGALQNALAASDARTPYYVVGIIMLYGILLGRWICGFLCPFGLIQELLHKIKTPKLKKGKITRVLSYFKYVILVVFVIVLPLIYMFKDFPLPAFCKYICPAGTLEGAIGLLSNQVNAGSFRMLGPIFSWKFLLMVSFLIGAVFIYRFFCRFFCPLGALYGLFNRISILGIKVDRSKCTDCGLCVSHCKMDIRHVGDAECINCGECMQVCPTKAIRWKGGKPLLAPNEIEGVTVEEAERIAEEHNAKIKRRNKILKIGITVFMILLLAVVLIYYNVIDKAPGEDTDSTPPGSDFAAFGYQVGDLCYEADLPLLVGDGGTFNISDTIGKVTVINFWYTSCGPCVQEMPHFARIAEEYGDQITVAAFHADMDWEDPVDYIASNWSNYDILFGYDTNDAYYWKLGGLGSYPRTLVLDQNNIVVAEYQGSVSYETLKSAVEAALN